MGFKISFLFILVTFSVFSTVYLCPAKKERHLRPYEKYRMLHGRPTFCNSPLDTGGCCRVKYPNNTCYKDTLYKINKDYIEYRYWYNETSMMCESFLWTRCSQNDNNFRHWEQCMDLCYVGNLTSSKFLRDILHV